MAACTTKMKKISTEDLNVHFDVRLVDSIYEKPTKETFVGPKA